MDANIELKTLQIDSIKAIISYKKDLEAIESNNPYSCMELLLQDSNTNQDLHYFVLTEKNIPLIVMPFIKVKIQTGGALEQDLYDVTSPYGYSGPIYNTNLKEEYIALFWKKVDLWYASNNIVSEFIRFSLNFNYKHYTGELHPTLLNVKGALRPMEQLWEQFKPKVRNNVRRARQDNLTSTIFYKNITKEQVEEFYTIYLATMKRNSAHKRYYYSLGYFENFVKHNPEKCAIILIYKDNTPISTELMLLGNDTVYSFLGGTDENYFSSRPNDFLKIKAMEWGYSLGKQFYILGGGRKNRDNLFNYKKTYFPKDTDVIFYTGRKIISEEKYHILNSFCKEHHTKAYQNNLEHNFFPSYRLESDSETSES